MHEDNIHSYSFSNIEVVISFRTYTNYKMVLKITVKLRFNFLEFIVTFKRIRTRIINVHFRQILIFLVSMNRSVITSQSMMSMYNDDFALFEKPGTKLYKKMYIR